MTPFTRIAMLLVAACATSAHADWTLDSESARVHFISVKAGKIAEVHRFERVTGTASSTGEVHIEIFLASVDTAIEIRNERMRSMLFEVAQFPRAVISATLDPTSVADLETGDTVAMTTHAVLAMHGREQEIALDVQVTATRDGGLQVNSVAPIVVQASDYALAAGVERLREVAGLPSISPAVPVTFSLHFNAD
jgi:polyisoprenoid-binding protein YceI